MDTSGSEHPLAVAGTDKVTGDDTPYDALIQSRRTLAPDGLEASVLDRRDGLVALPVDIDDYQRQRGIVTSREATLAFDYACQQNASSQEQRARVIVDRLRQIDNDNIYVKAPARPGYGGQNHPRFEGDHFLSNADLIRQTELFKVAKRMPKGAHLHIHFNACLLPQVLLSVAKTMPRMFITSDFPLTPDDCHLNLKRCEVQFGILAPEREKPGNLFGPAYKPRQTMRFQDFLQEFPRHFHAKDVDDWLVNKLVFHEQEAHHWLQTADGAWEKFNGRTRMMKGLFNYEKAYRVYTRECLEHFVDDNIQYAEIRPNFMTTNQLWNDEGTAQLNNHDMIRIIIEEYDRFQTQLRETKGPQFCGLKIIYCTPRSFSRELIRDALRECLFFKKIWPDWIAGFDLVGEESKGHPLSFFAEELLWFRRVCEAEGLDIPFLFHCGETLETGGEVDGNLIDALLLNSRRIGHGFALARHPYVMEQMKVRGVCLELCPISNEILGLTPRVDGHAMYGLLANGMHCTVNSDNGTLFKSTLSDDFYQAMVGSKSMSLHGWRQLAEWSIAHSCMTDAERQFAQDTWEKGWQAFLDWVLEEYGYLETSEVGP